MLRLSCIASVITEQSGRLAKTHAEWDTVKIKFRLSFHGHCRLVEVICNYIYRDAMNQGISIAAAKQVYSIWIETSLMCQESYSRTVK